MSDLQETLGRIDIYVLDQILKRRIAPGMRVLDAGCGTGRNLIYLLREGYDVSAVDRDPVQIERVRGLARGLAPGLPREQLVVAQIEALPFPDDAFEVVISCAVLHFARDEAHFEAMLSELARVLAPGGLLIARLASSIGIEDQIESLGSRRFHLPDGSDRFLVDEAYLRAWTDRLGATLLDPIKTTVVAGLRSMTTWVLRLPAPAPASAARPGE